MPEKKLDLFDADIATVWGSVELQTNGRSYRALYSDTMRRIGVFLTGRGEVVAAKYLRDHTAAAQFVFGNKPNAAAATFGDTNNGGSMELYLEQLFRCRSLVVAGGTNDEINPLPDAYDRYPEMRYMVCNLRGAVPLTSDVLWALQTIADSFDPLRQVYLPDDVGEEEDGRRYYAESGSPRDIASAAEAAGFAGAMVAMLNDIEIMCRELELPQLFYSVLAAMKREARDAKQRQAAAAPYLCRRLFAPVARLPV